MVGILSLNPCIDKTLHFEKLPDNGVNIPDDIYVQAGGKGVNVAKVLQAFGIKTKIFTMAAGKNGELLQQLLQQEELEAEVVEVSGNTREYITVLDKKNHQFALKEPGPQISIEERKKAEGQFSQFLAENKVSLLCICDTLACKVLEDFYAYAVKVAKRLGIPTCVDLDGEALKYAIAECPDIIKPNIDEYAGLMDTKPEKLDLKKEIVRLQKLGISNPVISLGKDGAITADAGSVFRCTIHNTKCVSPVGCGDSFVAGLIFGKEKKLGWEECMKWATAAGAANCEEWKAACLEYGKIAEKYIDVIVFRQMEL